MVPQRDWNCTECLRHTWHTGQRWQCVGQLSGTAESRSTTGSTVQHQADSAVNSGVCAQLQGKGFLCGTRPGWGWGFCSRLWLQGCSVVFPEINLKPQLCLSLFHLEQFKTFFFHPELPKNTMQGRLREQGFRDFSFCFIMIDIQYWVSLWCTVVDLIHFCTAK